MRDIVRLSNNEQMALTAWNGCDRDFSYLSFMAVERRSKLAGHLVRRTVRALARKGLLEFKSGLFTYEGEVAGAGYGPTALGFDALSQALSELETE